MKGYSKKFIALRHGKDVKLEEAQMLVEIIMTQMVSRSQSWDTQHCSCGEVAAPETSPARINWEEVSSECMSQHGLNWSAIKCQGMWKFLAYADMAAAMNVLGAGCQNDASGMPDGDSNSKHGESSATAFLSDSEPEDFDMIDPRKLTRADTRKKLRSWGKDALKKRKRSSGELQKHSDPALNPEKTTEDEDFRYFPDLLSCAIKPGLCPLDQGDAALKEITPLCEIACLPCSGGSTSSSSGT